MPVAHRPKTLAAGDFQSVFLGRLDPQADGGLGLADGAGPGLAVGQESGIRIISLTPSVVFATEDESHAGNL